MSRFDCKTCHGRGRIQAGYGGDDSEPCPECTPPSPQAVMVGLMSWLQEAKYRRLMHRHNGMFRATDEAFNVWWEADTLESLLDGIKKHKPIERAP